MMRKLKLQGGPGPRACLLVVSGAGLAVLLFTFPLLPFQEWQAMLLLAMLCGIAHTMRVSLFRSSAVTVSAAVTFAGLVLLGPAPAIWINIGASAVSALWPQRKPPRKVIFNLSNHALAAAVAGAVFLGAGGTVQPERPVTVVIPLLLSGIGYFLVQTFLVSGIIALTDRTSLFKTWDTNFKWSAPNFVALAIIGLGMAASEMYMGILGIAIFSIPLVMAWYSFKLYMAQTTEVRRRNEALTWATGKLEGSYLSTIRALAATVDAKDHYTHGHSEMTMRYAVAIAGELGLNEDEVSGVQVAALLHDVGKIGIPDGILNKPLKLTADEWGVVKEHPVVGAKVIQQVELLAAEADAVLYHHEHYDGTGYPRGLQGEEIPLPAQIIAVADAYQAMTSTRPYRRAHNREYALQEIQRCSGTQFNPRVVDAMLRAVRSERWARDGVAPKLPWLHKLVDAPAHALVN